MRKLVLPSIPAHPLPSRLALFRLALPILRLLEVQVTMTAKDYVILGQPTVCGIWSYVRELQRAQWRSGQWLGWFTRGQKRDSGLAEIVTRKCEPHLPSLPNTSTLIETN